MAEKTTAFTAQTKREGDTAVIDLDGEINGAADAALEAAYAQAAQANPKKFDRKGDEPRTCWCPPPLLPARP